MTLCDYCRRKISCTGLGNEHRWKVDFKSWDYHKLEPLHLCGQCVDLVHDLLSTRMLPGRKEAKIAKPRPRRAA